MNKKEFVEKLVEVTNLTQEEAEKVNDILENHMIIGKNNKEKIINEIELSLTVDFIKADSIYNNAMSIIGNELKEKIKHPFRSKD